MGAHRSLLELLRTWRMAGTISSPGGLCRRVACAEFAASWLLVIILTLRVLWCNARVLCCVGSQRSRGTEEIFWYAGCVFGPLSSSRLGIGNTAGQIGFDSEEVLWIWPWRGNRYCVARSFNLFHRLFAAPGLVPTSFPCCDQQCPKQDPRYRGG